MLGALGLAVVGALAAAGAGPGRAAHRRRLQGRARRRTWPARPTTRTSSPATPATTSCSTACGAWTTSPRTTGTWRRRSTPAHTVDPRLGLDGAGPGPPELRPPALGVRAPPAARGRRPQRVRVPVRPAGRRQRAGQAVGDLPAEPLDGQRRAQPLARGRDAGNAGGTVLERHRDVVRRARRRPAVDAAGVPHRPGADRPGVPGQGRRSGPGPLGTACVELAAPMGVDVAVALPGRHDRAHTAPACGSSAIRARRASAGAWSSTASRQTLTGSHAIPARASPSSSSPADQLYKAAVAGFDLRGAWDSTHGWMRAYFLGMDPRIKSRAFKFVDVDTSDAPLPSTLRASRTRRNSHLHHLRRKGDPTPGRVL